MNMDKFQDRIVAAAANCAAIADKQLTDIVEAAVKKHINGWVQPTQDQLLRVGLTINDIQYATFALGVRMGCELIGKLIADAASEEFGHDERSDAGKEPPPADASSPVEPS